jgi:hypothetical protein
MNSRRFNRSNCIGEQDIELEGISQWGVGTPPDGPSAYPPRLPMTVDVPVWPPSASSELMQRTKTCMDLLDHLIGAREQHRRHFDAKRLGGVTINHQLE